MASTDCGSNHRPAYTNSCRPNLFIRACSTAKLNDNYSKVHQVMLSGVFSFFASPGQSGLRLRLNPQSDRPDLPAQYVTGSKARYKANAWPCVMPVPQSGSDPDSRRPQEKPILKNCILSIRLRRLRLCLVLTQKKTIHCYRKNREQKQHDQDAQAKPGWRI